MNTIEGDVSQMRNKLTMEDNADKMNNDLQVNLNGERDSNVNLKQTIGVIDHSRTEVISRLRVL